MYSGQPSQKAKSRGTRSAASKGSGKDSTAGSAGAAEDPISSGLRKLWDEVALEPVPDDFLALLDQIETERETPGKTNDDPAGATSP